MQSLLLPIEGKVLTVSTYPRHQLSGVGLGEEGL